MEQIISKIKDSDDYKNLLNNYDFILKSYKDNKLAIKIFAYDIYENILLKFKSEDKNISFDYFLFNNIIFCMINLFYNKKLLSKFVLYKIDLNCNKIVAFHYSKKCFNILFKEISEFINNADKNIKILSSGFKFTKKKREKEINDIKEVVNKENLIINFINNLENLSNSYTYEIFSSLNNNFFNDKIKFTREFNSIENLDTFNPVMESIPINMENKLTNLEEEIKSMNNIEMEDENYDKKDYEKENRISSN